MIVIVKQNVAQEQLDPLINWLAARGLTVQVSKGAHQLMLGLTGDTASVDMDLIRAMEIVEDVKRIQEPYKNANRKFHPEDTIVQVGEAKTGGTHFMMIAGPCSVEGEAQIVNVARSVKAAGADILRGGAFKPRTSPYAFQGLHEEGIRLLLLAKKETGLPIVTEIMDLSQLKYFDEVDMIQIGARNMQNFELLKELGKQRKPILLKRGLSSTLEELLMSAEYIMAGGNYQVILCERGIRTFEHYTRNTLDLSAIPALHFLSHLPVIVDPSHATGRWQMVEPMAYAAAAAGADGLIVEVHNDPSHALCDGPQSLKPGAYQKLVEGVQRVRAAVKGE